MNLNNREVEFIVAFLKSPHATQYSTIHEWKESRRRSLENIGTNELKGTELKVMGMFINRIQLFTELGKTASRLRRPPSYGSKAQFSSYLCHILQYLREHPEHWTVVEGIVASPTSASASTTNNYPHVPNPYVNAIETATGAATRMMPSAVASSSSSPTPNAAHFNASAQHTHAMHTTSTSASCSTSSSTSQTPFPVNSIETIRGIECINLLQHPTGNLPHNLIAEYQRRSHYKGHPSKLRYEQVVIKQEKNAESSSSSSNNSYHVMPTLPFMPASMSTPQHQPLPPQDAPRNPMETLIVHTLNQYGFTDLQEVMGGLRHIQEQQMGMNMNDANGMAEQVMMFLITQREEKQEAEKMDEARRLSEITSLQEEEQRRRKTREEEEELQRQRRRREEEEEENNNGMGGGGNSDGGDDDIVMISYDDILCTTGPSACFPHSDILQCKKTVKVFRALLKRKDDVQNIIRKLLTLESKSRKWYGKIIPVPYFRHTLTDKIIRESGTAVHTSGSIPYSDRSHVVRILDHEISNLEKGMYTLSEQMENNMGLKYPKLFHRAEEIAKAKGLLVGQERDVIMLDDD